ncbi:hemagglutinin [Anaerobacillus alkalidiazotrophicus]|nr:hemagglutinin [Anaerobacillus alkalidiazotrophicus]
MTVTVDVKVLEEMEKQIQRLSKELNELKKPKNNGFEKLDTDVFLTEAYN